MKNTIKRTTLHGFKEPQAIAPPASVKLARKSPAEAAKRIFRDVAIFYLNFCFGCFVHPHSERSFGFCSPASRFLAKIARFLPALSSKLAVLIWLPRGFREWRVWRARKDAQHQGWCSGP